MDCKNAAIDQKVQSREQGFSHSRLSLPVVVLICGSFWSGFSLSSFGLVGGASKE